MTNRPTFRAATRFWLKLGCISFGGPAGQIAIMQQELVERKKWIDQERFLHALNFCMLLPGPEAQQLATYCGWLLHGARGAVVAGTLFVLPSALLLWGLSYAYVAYGQLPWVAAIFWGLKPAVTAIVAAAVIRLGQRALRTRALWVIATLAFTALWFFSVGFPKIVLFAAIAGWVATIYRPEWFRGGRDEATSELGEIPAKASWSRAAKIVAVWGALWVTPIIAAGFWQGWGGVLVREGLFFSQTAVVTFGGAYAVLPYVAQQAVENFHWLSQSQMVDGLGLAETTPGPLIMVLQFVGFLGGWHQSGAHVPLLTATLGAAMATWTTFVPCFLWVLLGAPHVEALRGHLRLSGALSAVTAAVVGVVLNLALWFAAHVFVGTHGEVDWPAVALAVGAFVALHRFKLNLMLVIAVCGAVGWLYAPV